MPRTHTYHVPCELVVLDIRDQGGYNSEVWVWEQTWCQQGDTSLGLMFLSTHDVVNFVMKQQKALLADEVLHEENNLPMLFKFFFFLKFDQLILFSTSKLLILFSFPSLSFWIKCFGLFVVLKASISSGIIKVKSAQTKHFDLWLLRMNNQTTGMPASFMM